MKIKDVKGERSFTILKDVIPYIEKFSENKNFQAIFNPDGLPEDKDELGEVMMERIFDNMPDLFATAKDSGLVGYFSLLEDTTPEDYCKDISVDKITSGLVDMFSDEHFRTFFRPRLKKAMAAG